MGTGPHELFLVEDRKIAFPYSGISSQLTKLSVRDLNRP